MKVYIPTPLRSYTNSSTVQATGATVAEAFLDLERQYRGIRFRVINEQDQIREHVKIFINQNVAENLSAPLKPTDELRIVMAISGG